MILVWTNKDTNRRETHYNIEKIIDLGNSIKIYYYDKEKVVEIGKDFIKINKFQLS